MLKKFILFLSLLLVLSVPANASLVLRCTVLSPNLGSVTEVDATLCSNVQAGDLITVHFSAGGSQTPITPTGYSLVTGGNQTNGAEKYYHFQKTAVGADAGAVVKCQVSSAAFIECRANVWYNTDGTAPQVGATNYSTASGVSSITFPNANVPTKSGSIIELTHRENAASSSASYSVGVINPTWPNPFGTGFGYIGDSSTAQWTAPTVTNGTSGNWMAAALEIQTSNGSSSGAVIVSDAGPQSTAGSTTVGYNVGSVRSSSDLTVGLFALANSAGTVTTPADALVQSSAIGSSSFVVPANAVANDIAVVCVNSNTTITKPGDFTSICTNSTNFSWECDYKILVSGDLGATKTWTTSSGSAVWSILRPITGATLSIDGASACASAVAGSSANAPSITTGSTNEVVLSVGIQAGPVVLTVPAGERPAAASPATNPAAGSFFQSTAGATGTKTFSSNTGGIAWELATIGIIGTGSSGSGWKLIGSVANTSANTSSSVLWVYSNQAIASGTALPFIYSSTGSFNVVDFITFGNATGVDGTPTTLAINQSNKDLVVPALPTLTASNELLLHASIMGGGGNGINASPGAGYSFINGLGSTLQLESVYSDASMNKSGYLPNGTSTALNSSGISMGLQSTSTPTRTTASHRVDQIGLVTLTPFGAPEPPPSCGGCGTGVMTP